MQAQELAIARGDDTDAAEALLAIVHSQAGREWIEGLLARTIASSTSANTRRLALVCVGHSARVRGRIGRPLYRRILSLRDDVELVGTLEDALSDIAIFARGHGTLDQRLQRVRARLRQRRTV